MRLFWLINQRPEKSVLLLTLNNCLHCSFLVMQRCGLWAAGAQTGGSDIKKILDLAWIWLLGILIPPPPLQSIALSFGRPEQSWAQREESYLTFVFNRHCLRPLCTSLHASPQHRNHPSIYAFVYSFYFYPLCTWQVAFSFLSFLLFDCLKVTDSSADWMTGPLYHQLSIRDSDGSLGHHQVTFQWPFFDTDVLLSLYDIGDWRSADTNASKLPPLPW